jgi:protein involved in ribonucleotide reduction
MDFIREDEGSACLAAITDYFGREYRLTFDDIAKKYVVPLDKAA